MKWGDSNWKAQSSSEFFGSSLSRPRNIRMTSSDFSFRLWAFSVLSARIWKATSCSGIRMAEMNFVFSFSRTARRGVPVGGGEVALVGSRLHPVHGEEAEDLPVLAYRVLVDRQRVAAVLLHLL